MKRYQIELNHGSGSKSWLYIKTSDKTSQEELEGFVKKAVRENDLFSKTSNLIFQSYKRTPTVLVKEYSMAECRPVIGGHKFRLKVK